MLVLPIHTPLLKKGDDIASMIGAHADMRSGDIVVVSSKAVATAEGTAIDLSALEVTDAAKEWSEKTGRSAEFCEAVLHETTRLNGIVRGSCPGALLTELRPRGLTSGVILAANAGLDESNVEEGHAIGWPIDPVKSAATLRKRLKELTDNDVAVLITDSCCMPRRWGVTAYALTVAGIEALKSEIGSSDLFGKKLRVTKEAIADQIAIIGNFLMGNASQSIPATIIRDHGVTLTDFEGWVPGIEPDEDLFASIL